MTNEMSNISVRTNKNKNVTCALKNQNMNQIYILTGCLESFKQILLEFPSSFFASDIWPRVDIWMENTNAADEQRQQNRRSDDKHVQVPINIAFVQVWDSFIDQWSLLIKPGQIAFFAYIRSRRFRNRWLTVRHCGFVEFSLRIHTKRCLSGAWFLGEIFETCRTSRVFGIFLTSFATRDYRSCWRSGSTNRLNCGLDGWRKGNCRW